MPNTSIDLSKATPGDVFVARNGTKVTFTGIDYEYEPTQYEGQSAESDHPNKLYTVTGNNAFSSDWDLVRIWDLEQVANNTQESAPEVSAQKVTLPPYLDKALEALKQTNGATPRQQNCWVQIAQAYIALHALGSDQ